MYMERFIAGRYLKAKKDGFISLISTFSLIGIALGVATLIVVMSVMNGFREQLFSRILGINGHISIYSSYSINIDNYEKIVKKALEANSVRDVFPIIDGQALVTQQDGSAKGIMIRGMKNSDIMRKKTLSKSISSEELARFKDDGVFIGKNLADNLNLGTGDKLPLISPKGAKTPFGIMPRMKTFEIAGIFDIGMYEYDANFVFIPLETAQSFFNMKDHQAKYIEVMVEDYENLRPTMMDLSLKIGNRTRILSWKDINSSYFNALNVEKNVMFLILTMIILIAAFNVISSMIMLVKDKNKGIAIMKSMGATKYSIMKIFFLTGSAIGVSGTLIGLALGLFITDNISNIQQFLNKISGKDLFSAEVYYLSQLPAKVNYNEVIAVVIIALILSLLSTLYPAWKASKIDPVEALRYE
ncbi:MAG: lipoprotein-releasing ABC transporter permease subunit [Alphaproteobacteria bacterium]|jgi:lipoprotein-releasing system permease protein|nr:lipoprotein-releasing ABC transporter permease subunit [Alphaproteobacteria bacterium]